MNECYKGGDVLNLVGLQMPNHMPLYIGGELWVLGYELLWATLAKDALPSLVSLAYSLYGVKFRHSHEPYIGG